MLGLAVCSLLLGRVQSPAITRDNYGVAMVKGDTDEDVYRGMGQAVAQDRLWQMELSRRSARGRLSEIIGQQGVASDRDVLRQAYTDVELQAQFDSMPDDIKQAFTSYAQGINDEITARKAAGKLPEGYSKLGFDPEPWSVLDSCAIAVTLARVFGTGGAGELRNLALLRYLDGQPCKAQKLDVFDDLAWINDPQAPTTVADEDDPVKDKPIFPNPTRSQTEKQLAAMPKTNLLELAGAMAETNFDDSRLMASTLGTPFEEGSYAVVVSPTRSTTGNPILLGAPQMGHTVPSVIHEIDLDGGSLHVVGMDVPGVPGVVIGHNRDLAWTLTSGVADVEDIYYSKLLSADTYEHFGVSSHLSSVSFTIHPKGGNPIKVNQDRTIYGPVLLKSASSKAIFSKRSTLWKNELTMATALLHMPGTTSAQDVRKAVSVAATSFNVFYACKSGDIGFQYVGHVPRRNPNTDPRLPSLDTLDYDWNGMIPFDQMPHVENPKGGLLYNWNTKPVSWWSNGDTPVWGKIFRSQALGSALGLERGDAVNNDVNLQPGIGVQDVEKAAYEIARKNSTGYGLQYLLQLSSGADQSVVRTPPLPIFDPFKKLTEDQKQFSGYRGEDIDGSVGATIYYTALREVRKSLFSPAIGTLTGDALFEQAVQPSLIQKALEGSTKYNYMGTRTQGDILAEGYQRAVAGLKAKRGPNVMDWGFHVGAFNVGGGEAPVQYDNRGTYMQIIELGSSINARNVVVPGVAETGPHSLDQVPLSRTWTYKPMWQLDKAK